MSSEVSEPFPEQAPAVLDARSLLLRVDRTIRRYRVALGRDHGDADAWLAFGMAASEAQFWRHALRGLANLLHVERATARGRLHGTRFATVDEQRAWLASVAEHRWRAARAVGLPDDATLARLRAGMIATPA
jgi:hypothetical protein